jgi:hypothetical protein
MSAPKEINLAGSDQDVDCWIWKTLVPKSGPAAHVQAEILRAIEKLRWEAQNNGNINWDDGFEWFIDFIQDTLFRQPCFSSADRVAMQKDLDRLRYFTRVNDMIHQSDLAHGPYINDDLYDRLTSHLITYCRYHPQLILHIPHPKQSR